MRKIYKHGKNKLGSFAKKYLALFLSALFFVPLVSAYAESQKESSVQDPGGKVSQTNAESKLEARSQDIEQNLDENPKNKTTHIDTAVEVKADAQVFQQNSKIVENASDYTLPNNKIQITKHMFCAFDICHLNLFYALNFVICH